MDGKIGGLRGTGRKQARDIDYAHKLTTFDREWLRQFLFDLPKDASDYRDITSQFRQVPGMNSVAGASSVEDEDGSDRAESTQFAFYRCPRCRKREECSCPQRQRGQPYGIADWHGLVGSPEEAMLAAEQEEALSLLPYGTAPEHLAWGVKVKICLPRHYLNKCLGHVRAYRVWTDQYLIEAERPGRAGEDGTRSATTMCWVLPMGLKLA
jgi:hypothetical protein